MKGMNKNQWKSFELWQQNWDYQGNGARLNGEWVELEKIRRDLGSMMKDYKHFGGHSGMVAFKQQHKTETFMVLWLELNRLKSIL